MRGKGSFLGGGTEGSIVILDETKNNQPPLAVPRSGGAETIDVSSSSCSYDATAIGPIRLV